MTPSTHLLQPSLLHRTLRTVSSAHARADAPASVDPTSVAMSHRPLLHVPHGFACSQPAAPSGVAVFAHVFGHPRTVFSTTGLPVRRGFALESAAARVCRKGPAPVFVIVMTKNHAAKDGEALEEAK